MKRSAIFLMLLGGCTGRTEIVVGVATDLRAKGEIDHVQFLASREGTPLIDHSWDLVDAPPGDFELPGSFGIYSPDGSEPRVELSVKGFQNGTLVTERDSVLSLVSGKTLFMRMAIVGDCGSLSQPTCGAGQTCVEGMCRPTAVDAHRFPDFKKEMVTSVECDSGTHFIRTSTGDLMPLVGSCEAGEFCQEGTCYKLLHGEDGALQQGLWTQQPTPTTYVLRALWGTPDGADIFAVGDHGTILHLAGAGPMAAAGWAMETPPTTENLYAVWGTSVGDVWAAGAGGTFVHRDGTGSWTMSSPVTSARIEGLFADAVDDAWAVGRSAATTPVALHWTGGTWSATPIPSANDLRGVWGSGANDLWLVGHGSLVVHGNGSAFTALQAPPKLDFTSVAGGGGSVFIVGLGGVILAGDLTAQDSPVTSDLFHVWVSPTGSDAYAVGDLGVIVHGNAGKWTVESSGTVQPLLAVWGAPSGDLYAAGRDGTLLHNTGTAAACAVPADCPNACAAGMLTPRSCMNGACAAASPAPCAAGLGCADATSCHTTCAADGDCLDPAYCDSGGVCRAPQTQGSYCDDQAGCAQAGCRICGAGLFCTNNVCCNMSPSQCSGCMQCSAPSGTCLPVPYGDDPGGFCAAQKQSSGNECVLALCNGAGGCDNTGDACGSDGCSPFNNITPSDCKAGSCVVEAPSPCPSTSCGTNPQQCSTGSGGCSQDSDCINTSPTLYCDGHHLCVPKKPNGAPCNLNSPLHCASQTPPLPTIPPSPCNECQSGNCVDGVCCNAPCNGQCQACDLPGKEGTCSTVTGPPHPNMSPTPRPSPCPGSGACAGYCDGTSASSCALPAGVCALGTCDSANNYTLKQASSCAAGACPAQTAISCEPFACFSGACLTRCASNNDCASTAPICDIKTGSCH